MRPSRIFVTLVITLAGVSVLLVLLMRDMTGAIAILWGGLILFAIVDLLTTTSRRNFSADIELPKSGFTNSTVPLRIELSVRRGVLPAPFEIRLTMDDGLNAGWDVSIEPDKGANEILLQTAMALNERGIKKLSRFSMKYDSRFRLFEVIANWPLDLAISVMPNITPILNGTIQTQILPLLDGAKDMQLRGEGSEFHQLRDFVAGMDPRSIDWKRSARMRRLTARETRAERNQQIMICLDSGHLMGERLGNLSKLDQSINASLALAWAGGIGGDLVGFYNFNSRPHQYIPPRPGRLAFSRILAVTAAIQHDTAETNHTLGLSNLNIKLARRSLIVIFSDFADSVTAELLVENLAVMTHKHLILYVTIRDPALRQMTNPADILMDSIARSVSARQILQERQQVFDRMRRLGILCLDIEPNELTPSLVSRYIDIKAKELI